MRICGGGVHYLISQEENNRGRHAFAAVADSPLPTQGTRESTARIDKCFCYLIIYERKPGIWEFLTCCVGSWLWPDCCWQLPSPRRRTRRTRMPANTAGTRHGKQ